MTRKLFTILFIFSFMTTPGCSLFTSDDRISADDLEIESADFDEDFDEESSDDFEDDGESVASEDEFGDDFDEFEDETDAPNEVANSDNSFDDIEDFNNDIIDNELSDAGVDEDFEESFDEDLDELDGDDSIISSESSEGDFDEDLGDGLDDDFEEDLDEIAGSDDDLDLEDSDDDFFTEEGSGQDTEEDLLAQEPTESIVDESVIEEDSLEDELGGTDFVTESEPVEVAPTIEEPVADLEIGGRNKIKNLEYKSGQNGGTVLITAEDPITYTVTEEPAFNQVIIEVPDVFLPNSLKRPYIAKDFGQPVATINAYQGSNSTTARFIVQYKNLINPKVSVSGNQLSLMSLPQDLKQVVKNNANKVFDGIAKKISINVEDVDIKEVIKLIAAETRVNIMIDSDVRGETTVSLTDVPWDKALVTILRSNNLGYRREGNILRIGKQDKLTKEVENLNKQISGELSAKRELVGRKVRFYPINYADVGELFTQVKSFVGESGQISKDERSNTLIVSEYPDILDKIAKVVESMDTPPMQIVIEGKIIEANEEFSREVGTNLTVTSSNNIGDKILNSNLGTSNSLETISGGLSGLLRVGTFDILGDLRAILSIREREKKVKVLSSPRITVLNKQSAEISQTTQIPVNNATPQGGATGLVTTTTFQSISLSLKVTPQITFNGEVLMNVDVSREIPGAASSSGARSVESRNAKTSVLVPNGKTMVIGGIYQNDTTEEESGVPFLRNIPILGYLFKSKTKEIKKNELLIFLTPRILNNKSSKKSFQLAEGSQIDTSSEFSSASSLEDDTIEGDFEDFDSDLSEDNEDFDLNTDEFDNFEESEVL